MSLVGQVSTRWSRLHWTTLRVVRTVRKWPAVRYVRRLAATKNGRSPREPGSVDDTQAVTAVDANDDTLDRFVVWHYRFDAERHERRNVVVAAFDGEGEFIAEIERRSAGLQRQSDPVRRRP